MLLTPPSSIHTRTHLSMGIPMVAKGCPVCSARSSFISFFSFIISSAWMAMSVAWPWDVVYVWIMLHHLLLLVHYLPLSSHVDTLFPLPNTHTLHTHTRTRMHTHTHTHTCTHTHSHICIRSSSLLTPALPCGWCIITLECGRQCLIPLAPAASRNAPILQACPTHHVATGGRMYCIVS